MLVLLTTAVASACLCVGPDDPAWLAEKADRVYRGRVVELWFLGEEGSGYCDETLVTCNSIAGAGCPDWPVIAVLEVLEVWKGPAEPRIRLHLQPGRGMWIGWTDVVFQVGDCEVSCCDWDRKQSLGPPRFRFEVEPTVEELLWEAVAGDDLEAVRNALANKPRLDLPSLLEDDLVAGCPPPAYDELILAGARSVDSIAGCSPERILPMLDIVPSGDPGWKRVAFHADVPLLTALEAAGIPMEPISTPGFFSAWGRVPAMAWWLERGADPTAVWVGTSEPYADGVYAVLAGAGVYPDCMYAPWELTPRTAPSSL